MFKKRKRLLRGGIVAGLMVMNCFCCFIFRTRLATSTLDDLSALAASLEWVAWPASAVTGLPFFSLTQIF